MALGRLLLLLLGLLLSLLLLLSLHLLLCLQLQLLLARRRGLARRCRLPCDGWERRLHAARLLLLHLLLLRLPLLLASCQLGRLHCRHHLLLSLLVCLHAVDRLHAFLEGGQSMLPL